ncbi:hypothetical protein ACFLY2_02290 [Patescibacteria group bacterium]
MINKKYEDDKIKIEKEYIEDRENALTKWKENPGTSLSDYTNPIYIKKQEDLEEAKNEKSKQLKELKKN